MDKQQLEQEYQNKLPLFERAGKNVKEAMEIFLTGKQISYLTVSYRVKSFESFYEKIFRKDYKYPFFENDDFVGVRAIVYYPSDIDRVIKIINTEFDIVESEDKSAKLDVNEFGYRSHHSLVNVKEAWFQTPNYRELNGIKVEIQVRTILMHAWAEIEHKLQYKNKEQVPKELQRKLFLLSAKFEEADTQFQELKQGIESYKNKIARELRISGNFDTSLELNLETFKEFLSFFYPDNEKHDVMTRNILEEIQNSKLSLTDLVKYAKQLQPYEKLLQNKIGVKIAAPALFSYALDIFCNEFKRKSQYTKKRDETILFMKDTVKKAA